MRVDVELLQREIGRLVVLARQFQYHNVSELSVEYQQLLVLILLQSEITRENIIVQSYFH